MYDERIELTFSRIILGFEQWVNEHEITLRELYQKATATTDKFETIEEFAVEVFFEQKLAV